MAKCQAIAAATGQQCRARALRGGEFCVYHSEQTRPKNIIDAIRDKRVFGRFFGDLETWRAWMTKNMPGANQDDGNYIFLHYEITIAEDLAG